MTEYAHVADGTVRELYTPPDGASIEDCFEPTLAAKFIPVPDGAGVQVGWLYTNDAFSAPSPPAPTLAQQAREAISAGIQIVSASTPAISGTYPLDQASQLKSMAIGNYIAVWSAFPGGSASLARFDIAGEPHVFSSTEAYMKWLRAVADYTTALDLIADTDSGELPTQPVEID